LAQDFQALVRELKKIIVSELPSDSDSDRLFEASSLRQLAQLMRVIVFHIFVAIDL
jgi:hypothetical protein